ncbi:MAG TPA: hypothetical protein P5528_02855 [Steroidobacteraceae bacterium]|nr:hypothetical protein [Steroidobacteraceae bacterium]HRX88363.1 hypothetical protein [Steroidobacteraceae bacterium]
MRWKIEAAIELESADIEATRLWDLALRQLVMPDFALGLCLLWQDLVSAIELVSSDRTRGLILERGKEPGSYEAVVDWKRDSALLVLSPTELEMLMVFCLKSVRDGAAEVDHIDIEARNAVASGKPGSFVFKFPQSATPVHEKEARRRLGL